jgi:hypothetical protein
MFKGLTGTGSRVLASAAIVGALVMGGNATRAVADQTADHKARQVADEQEMLEKARREAGRERATVNIGESATDKETLAKKRQAELQSLSEKLRRAQSARVPKVAGPVDTPWTTEVVVAPSQPLAPEQRSALGHKTTAPSAYDSRVTVLMVITPGTKGIRRFEKTADPILCARDGCYISNGAETASRFISLSQSLGAANTFGQRAGACNQSTGCVFRGVDVSGSDAILQPVDLKVMVHDRRNVMPAYADMSCKVDMGRLSCARPIVGTDYTLWVVPERVAEQAGAALLQNALSDGLPPAQQRADLPWLRN